MIASGRDSLLMSVCIWGRNRQGGTGSASAFFNKEWTNTIRLSNTGKASATQPHRLKNIQESVLPCCTSKIATKIYNLGVSRDQAAPLVAHVASATPRSGYRSEWLYYWRKWIFWSSGQNTLNVVDCFGVGFSRLHISLYYVLGYAEDSIFLCSSGYAP